MFYTSCKKQNKAYLSYHLHPSSILFHFSLSCIGEGNGTPLQCSCLENPRDGGAWWAAVYGVAQSRTQLKRLSSSSSSSGINYLITYFVLWFRPYQNCWDCLCISHHYIVYLKCVILLSVNCASIKQKRITGTAGL